MLIQDVVKGALKLNQLPERQCFTSWLEFVQSLPDLLSVEVPAFLGGVIASQSEPSEDQRNALWLRLSSNGAVLGLYAFQKGSWEIIQPDQDPFRPYWEIGDSSNPPKGYTPILPGDPVIPSNVVTWLVPQYLILNTGPPITYQVYTMRWTGY